MARLRFSGWALVLLVLVPGVWAQAPVLAPGAIVNGASFRAAADPNGAITGGAIVAVFGLNLSSDLAVALSVPLSTALNNSSLVFTSGANTFQAPLYFVSTQQVNAQAPFELPVGTVTAKIVSGAQTTLNSNSPVQRIRAR